MIILYRNVKENPDYVKWYSSIDDLHPNWTGSFNGECYDFGRDNKSLMPASSHQSLKDHFEKVGEFDTHEDMLSYVKLTDLVEK